MKKKSWELFFSKTSKMTGQIEIPAFYEDLLIEAYSEKGKVETRFRLDPYSTSIVSDFTGSFKTSGTGLPTNVLYGVNCPKDIPKHRHDVTILFIAVLILS